MRFLRRGDSGPRPTDAELAAFWAWWRDASEGIAAAIDAGQVEQRAEEITRAVHALHGDLAWELAKGLTAANLLVVSPEGNPELRPIALRWAASAPPADAVWDYRPSRQAGPPGVLRIADATVDLAEMRAVTTWDEARERLAVRLWHPAFEGLPDGPCVQIAFLFLDNLLGEDDVERWAGAIEIDPAAQAGKTVDELAAEFRRRGESATGEHWVLIEGTNERGEPVVVRLNASLKRIDHPYADRHLEVAVKRGLDDGGNRDLIDAIFSAEEELGQSLSGLAIEVAHVTDRRRRVTHFVCEDGDRALAIARAWARHFRAWGAEAKFETDPHWQFRRQFDAG
jgi:hypothetical protein